MAYQYDVTPPRTGYGHPPPQHQSSQGQYNDYGYDDRSGGQGPSTQQRRADGYYNSGFWRDYGARPLSNGNHGMPPRQQQQPQQWTGPPRGESLRPPNNAVQMNNSRPMQLGGQMAPAGQTRGPPADNFRGPPRDDYGTQNGPAGQHWGPQSQNGGFRNGSNGPLRVVNEMEDDFQPRAPSRGNTMPVNGSGPPNPRHRPSPLGNGPPAQQRQPLIDPNSPTRLAWDNPFPVFPTKAVRSQTAPPESSNNSRPPTAASKNSGRSTASRQSERSNHSTEATSYENSIRDPMRDLSIGGGPYDDRPGPMSRSATMPVHNGFPSNDRRPSATSQHSGMSNFGASNNRFDGQDRSASSASFRNKDERAEFGALTRAQTFDANPYAFNSNQPSARDPLDDYMPNFDNAPPPQAKADEYMPNFDEPNSGTISDEYMPNFDGPSNTGSLADSLGIPLDGAPGIGRGPNGAGSMDPYSEPSDLRGRFDDLSFDGPRFDSPAPDDGYRNGPQINSSQQFQPRGSSRGGMNGARGGAGGMGQGGHNPYQHGPEHGDMRMNSWGDARSNGTRSAPPGRGPPQNRISDNPDALPSHPVPVRMGHSQQQSNRAPPQMQRRQQQPQRDSDVPARPASPPVTHEELNHLREKLKSAPSDYKSHLRLAKRLIKASDTLIDTQGDLDLKTRNKNRERFVLEAHKVIKKLVGHSYPEAMFYLAECYGAGSLGLQTDHKEAFSLYASAAKLGHAGAAYRTAVSFEIGGEGARRDPQKAVQWYRRAAALGDVGAMYKLGVILLRGLLGQQANPGEGLIWLNRAAERADEDNPHAVHELALLHEFPTRSSKIVADPKYALQLYQQAAKLGYSKSQTRLGKAFEHGQLNCPFDDRASIHWYSKAAAQEDAEAEMALSGWYLTGAPGVLEPNEQESYLWARKSALREYPKAEFAMGHFSEVGIGCQVNLEDAKRWYGRSASRSAVENLRRPGHARQRRKRYSRSQPNEECTIM